MIWGLRFLFLNVVTSKTYCLVSLSDSLCLFIVRLNLLFFSDFHENFTAILNTGLSISKIFFEAARIYSLLFSDNAFFNFNESIYCSCTLNHQCLNLFVFDGLWRDTSTIHRKRRGYWQIEWGWTWQKSWEHRRWQKDRKPIR